MKTSFWLRAVSLTAVVLSAAAMARADVVILNSVADTSIRADQPGLAQGENPLMLVGDVAANGALRGLLSFDLAAPVLDGATIRRVSLRLRIDGPDQGSEGAVNHLDLHALTEPFAERKATWREREAGVAWSAAGGTSTVAVLARVSENPKEAKSGKIVVFEGPALTAAVANARGGPLNLLLKVSDEDAVRGVFRFNARGSAAGPQLVIDYASPAGASAVTPIPGHAARPMSAHYRVTAGGRAVEVRAERFGFDVAMFDLAAEGAAVTVDLPVGAGAFTLKPERHGLRVTREGDRLSFALPKPLKLVLQVDGLTPLAILATPPETDAPRPGDPDVVYFAPGVTTAGVIRPKSNQTIYLAPGALVKGRIEAKHVSNVTVKGRGILETSGYSDRAAKTHGILFEHATGIVVEGIGVRSHDTWWQTLFLNSRKIEVAHLNIFGVGVNTDGVDIDGVRDFVVRDSFIRCEDDGLGWHSLDAAANGEPITERARASDLVIWNTHAGNGIRIGASMETQLWRDILIENIDILMHAGGGLYSDFSDWAWCENLVFRNIFIEKPTKPITFKIAKTRYSNATGFLDELGHYDGLVFENVISKGGVITLAGHDAEHRIDNVYFNGCVNGGRPVDGPEDITTNAYVSNVRFNQPLAAKAATPPGRHEAEYLESSTNTKPQITYADAQMGNGKGRVFKATATGDRIAYAIEGVAPGDYRVAVRVKRTPASGRFQLAVNGAAQAATQDLFAATPDYRVLELGTVTFKGDGVQTFTFTTVEKNPASTGHQLDIDYIALAR